MKYGIVGASGTLGRVVVQHLLQSDTANSVNALVRRPDERLQGFARCQLLPGGIFDAAGVDGLARDSDVIVNLAARNPGVPEEDDADLYDFYEVNALGAGIIAAAGRRWSKPVIHFSSVAVYETGRPDAGASEKESDGLPVRETAMHEFHDSMVDHLETLLASNSITGEIGTGVIRQFLLEKPHPAGAPLYGLSKLVGETLAGRLADRSCAIRMSDVYGPGHESRGVVTDHLNALRSDDRVVVDFDFRSSVCFVYVKDVCRLIADVAVKAVRVERLPTIVNFCGPRLTEAEFRQSLADLAERHGVQKTVTLSDSKRVKFDRRYAREVYASFFAGLSTTPFSEGLESTWLADRR